MGKKLSISEQLQLIKQPIIAKCMEGEKCCSKVNKDGPFNSDYVEGVEEFLKYYCESYAFPTAKWRNGNCNMADHLAVEVKKDKVRVGQQKQKKKG